MAAISITMKLDNAAMRDEAEGSGEIYGPAIVEQLDLISRLLEDSTPQVGDGRAILDGNGNTIGEWKITD